MKKVLKKPKRDNSYSTSLHLFANNEISVAYSGKCIIKGGGLDKEKASKSVITENGIYNELK